MPGSSPPGAGPRTGESCPRTELLLLRGRSLMRSRVGQFYPPNLFPMLRSKKETIWRPSLLFYVPDKTVGRRSCRNVEFCLRNAEPLWIGPWLLPAVTGGTVTADSKNLLLTLKYDRGETAQAHLPRH